MAITSFADVQEFFNTFINNNNIQMDLSPHSLFWQQTNSKQDYDLFINGTVPGGVTDPDTGNPIPILTKVNGKYSAADSAIVHALSGTTTLFAPSSPQPPYFGQMPGGGPYFSPEQIQELADWIDAQCPE